MAKEANQFQVGTYYQIIGKHACTDASISVPTNNLDIDNVEDTFFFDKIKGVVANASVLANGRVCCMSYEVESSVKNQNYASAFKGDSQPDYTKISPATTKDLFMRVQEITIHEKPITQIKQTFDGIYASAYGGSIAQIHIRGITNLWSTMKWKSGQHNTTTNVEAAAIREMMVTMAQAKNAVFSFQDGFRSQKIYVIPSSFATSKTVSQNNMETYNISFYGSSFQQKMVALEASGYYGGADPLYRFNGPTASFKSFKVI